MAASATPISSSRPPSQAARLSGFLFIAAIFAYATGEAMLAGTLRSPDAFQQLPSQRMTLGLGALLMLLNSAIVVAIGVALLPLLTPHSPWAAHAYLATRVVEAVLLAVGVAFLLALTALAGQEGEGVAPETFAVAKALCLKAQFFCYQIAMGTLGAGSLVLCHLMLVSRLVPVPLAVWGYVGYAVFLLGSLLEVLGVGGDVGLILCVPGGLFEVGFGIYLMVYNKFGRPGEAAGAKAD